uniref:Uncharacterized protein n=1 Tax=Anopheles christyi TaxID=43041 RepID=A0A240PKQ2_9DIPT
MVSQAARLWVTVVLLSSLYRCPASGEQTNSPSKRLCLSEAGAILAAPPITCQPLSACDGEAILKSYLNLFQQCRINASERANERDNFQNRLNYWQSDHVFLFELVEQAHEPHKLILESEQLANNSAAVVPELQRKLLIYSIEAGRIEDALILHLTLKGQWKPNQIVEAIEDDHIVNEAIVEHLLEFIRALPVKRVRADFYKAVALLIRRHQLASKYVTLIFAGDATGVFSTQKERDDHISQPLTVLIHLLRQQLRNLKFEYNLWLADNFPHYYTFYIENIFFFPPELWQKIEKRRLFEISGMFKAKGHRFAAIERFLKFTHQYDARNRANLEKNLPTLARETEQLRKTIEQTGNDSKELARVKKLEESFVNKEQRWNRHNHRSYLHIIKLKGKFGANKMEMERKS